MDLKTSDRKKLWGLAAAKCSMCGCELFQKKELGTNIGKECHISSHKPDHPSKEFSRYNSSLTDDERDKSYDNTILLCGPCHDTIDNPKNTKFTVEILNHIKEKHEADIKEHIENPKKFEAEGKLLISEIITQQNRTEGTCKLDFRVTNIGGSDLQINYVKLKVLDFHKFYTLGYQESSQTYGLDISPLKEIGNTINLPIAQIIKPRETDRFDIVLIAGTMSIGEFRLWKLEPKLLTNFGEVLGNPVEVWLPYIPEAFSQSFIENMNKYLESLE